MESKRILVGEKFILEGLLTQEELFKAILEQKSTKEKLGEALLRMGFIGEDDYLNILSNYLGVRHKRLNLKEISSETRISISREIMEKYTVFPIMRLGSKLSVAMVDPLDKDVIEAVTKATKLIILPVLALRREIEACISESISEGDKGIVHDLKHEFTGERFIHEGVATGEDVQIALIEQKNTGEKLGEILLRMGVVKEDDFLRILSEYLGVRFRRVKSEEVDLDNINNIPTDLMKKYLLYPIRKLGNKLTVAMVDPLDVHAIEAVEKATKCLVLPVLALKSEIEKMLSYENSAMERVIEEDLSKENFTEFDYMEVESNMRETNEETEEERISEKSAPVIKAVNSIILNAVSKKASDIHIEPEENRIRIRYRIDGVLKEVLSLPKKISLAVVSRIKILSELDIAEKRLPQDGRFRIKADGKEIDFRVSVLPISEGEKVVLRILNKENLKLNLEELGFEADELKKFYKVLEYPYGIVLVTGPTGSGKTTTLYSALNKINKEEINIVTAEDPIEYKIKGINQTNCKTDIGFNFAAALRAFLRQDPDVIMVGEIRDAETAEIAVKASLTGHLVFSTVHTNDAPSTIQRLINMGIEPFLIASSLIMVQAQRLGRRVCKKCKIPDNDYERILKILNVDPENYKNKVFYKGAGCYQCNNTGYTGRVGFYEIMVIDDEIRELIASGKNTEQIRTVAKRNGMKTLREQALLKAEQGVTSLEEVLRNTIE